MAQLTREAEALRESEARFCAVTESALDAIIADDAAGAVFGWNRAAKQVFGCDEAEILGKTVFALVPPRCREVAGERHFSRAGLFRRDVPRLRWAHIDALFSDLLHGNETRRTWMLEHRWQRRINNSLPIIASSMPCLSTWM